MTTTYYKYGPTAILLIFMYFGLILFRPFLMPVMSAAILAYLFYPIYRFVNNKLDKKGLSSLIMILFIVLLIVFPIFYMINTLIAEIPALYSSLVAAAEHIDVLNELFANIYNDYGISIELQNIFGSVTATLLGFFQGILLSIPQRAFDIGITGFFLFFFFKDGEAMLKKTATILPFGKKKSHNIFSKIKAMTDAVVYGQLITALVQAFFCLLAYFILGVKAPVFWALMTFIFSMIPMIGPGIVYVPLSVSLFIGGLLQNSNWGIARGIILLIYGLLWVSSIDNIIKPFLISDKVNIHPALILIGVVGGLLSFGVMGLVLGPLILVVILTILETYKLPQFDK